MGGCLKGGVARVGGGSGIGGVGGGGACGKGWGMVLNGFVWVLGWVRANKKV